MKVIKVLLKDIEQNENSRVIYKVDDLAELMASMKKDGLLQPVAVRAIGHGKFDAVYGNRRIVAAKKLGWDSIDTINVGTLSEVDRDVLGLIENWKRKNTSLAEDGRMIRLLMDKGLSVPELAARLGVTKHRIKAALDIISYVPVARQKDVESLKPSVAHALVNLKKTHQLNKKQFDVVLTAAEAGMGVQKLKQVSPLISSGESVTRALRSADSYRVVSLEMLVDTKEAARIEKQTGMTLRQFLTDKLVSKSGLKTLRAARVFDKAPTNKASA